MRTRRGFTLVEILIALAVSAVALVAAVAAANAQQRAFYSGQKGRAAQNAGRAALLLLEQKLPLAGFGMDAPLALDFGWYAPGGAAVRDRIDGSDELVFYARDPSYWVPEDVAGAPRGRAWNVADLTADSVTVVSHGGEVFRKGQVLQLVCPGVLRYAYFTVAATEPAPAAGGDVALKLEPVVAANPFRRQDELVGHACVTAGARLFLIDRYRFYVRTVNAGGRTDPYLVLDQGVDRTGEGTVDLDDELLVAEGIESFQVSYVFTAPALAPAGETPGTQLALPIAAAGTAANTVTRTTFPGVVAAGQSLYEPSSFYRHRLLSPLPPERLTNHQGNVRTIRISLVARSPEPDPATTANLTWTAGSPLWRMNQSAAPAWVPADGGYQRAVLDTSVTLPNMTVRALSYF